MIAGDYLKKNLNIVDPTEPNRMKIIGEELQKCKDSPYYFATTYMKVMTPMGLAPFTTILKEEAFNRIFNKYNGKIDIDAGSTG